MQSHPLESAIFKMVQRGPFEAFQELIIAQEAKGLTMDNLEDFLDSCLLDENPIVLNALSTITERFQDLEGVADPLPLISIPECGKGIHPMSSGPVWDGEDGPRCSRNVIQNDDSCLALEGETWSEDQFHVYCKEGTTGRSDAMAVGFWPVAKHVPEPPLLKDNGQLLIGASLKEEEVVFNFTKRTASKKRFRRGPGMRPPAAIPVVDRITPKVDGCGYSVEVKDGKAWFIGRDGVTWEGEAPDGLIAASFGVEVTAPCLVRMGQIRSILGEDLEWARDHDHPGGMHLIWIDMWNVPNIWGVKFLDYFRSRKKVRIKFSDPFGERRSYTCREPRFGDLTPPHDGVVVHSGRSQYWYKFEPSIDLDEALHAELKKDPQVWLSKWDRKWKGVVEFKRVVPWHYEFCRERPDRLRPNSKENVYAVLSSVDVWDMASQLEEEDIDIKDLF